MLDVAERASAIANVRAAESEVAAAQLSLRYTELHSPDHGPYRSPPGRSRQPGRRRAELAGHYSITSIRSTPTSISARRFAAVHADASRSELPDRKRCRRPCIWGLKMKSIFPIEGSSTFASLDWILRTGTARRRGIFPNPDGHYSGTVCSVCAAIGSPRPDCWWKNARSVPTSEVIFCWL